ncbi:hypothetical protein BC629DRAFT_1595843 [Irpex lacteus]|nr:hypothetical protein BC629DRAFT_1595843 [Irpex lacteus]
MSSFIPSNTPLEAILAQMDLDLTFGAAIISGLIISALYGITSLQTFVYFHNKPRDGISIKFAIFVLWIIDSLGLAMSTHTIYTYCVKALVDPTLWYKVPWSDGVHFLLMVQSDAIVTIIFAYRIWKLGVQPWSQIFILLPEALVFGGHVMGIFAIVVDDLQELRSRVGWLFYTVFSLQVFSDIVIMSSSVFRYCVVAHSLLHVRRSSVGLAILLTGIFSPGTFLWQGLSGILPKLMLNAMLAHLNMRDSLREKASSETPISVHLSRLDPLNSDIERSVIDPSGRPADWDKTLTSGTSAGPEVS